MLFRSSYKMNPNYRFIQFFKNIVNFFNLKKTITSKTVLETLLNRHQQEKENNIDNNENNNYREYNIEDMEKINIEKSGFFHLEKIFLPNTNLSNILELELENNNISNIQPLLRVNLTNLEKLNLKLNKIGDNMIKVINKLKLPKLKIFILELNNFTHFNIFHAIELFTNLEIFNISSNRLYKNNIVGEEKKIYSEKSYQLNSLKELYANNGVFSNNTLDILFKFKVRNLAILGLNGNGLSTLSFLRILMNIYPLKKLYLNMNAINWDIESYEKIKINENLNVNSGLEVEMKTNHDLDEEKRKEIQNIFKDIKLIF